MGFHGRERGKKEAASVASLGLRARRGCLSMIDYCKCVSGNGLHHAAHKCLQTGDYQDYTRLRIKNGQQKSHTMRLQNLI